MNVVDICRPLGTTLDPLSPQNHSGRRHDVEPRAASNAFDVDRETSTGSKPEASMAAVRAVAARDRGALFLGKLVHAVPPCSLCSRIERATSSSISGTKCNAVRSP